MNAASIGDQGTAVRKMLETVAPCETGYPGITVCKDCPGCYGCADTLEKALTQEFPSTEWAPAIREVLGLW